VLRSDGRKLYVHYAHHYDGDRDRYYLVDSATFTVVYQRVIEMLVAEQGGGQS
jgi:hypothetical protein